LLQISEVFSDWVFILKELLHKRLVDYGDVPGCGRVLFGNPATLHNLGADALKISVTNSQPRCLILIAPRRSGSLTLDKDVGAPVISLHRAVERKTDAVHAGNRRQVVMELAIKHGQSFRCISSHGRIKMQNVTIRHFESEILMLHVAQALGQQSRGAQQNQR
jgi:hypothetical protein